MLLKVKTYEVVEKLLGVEMKYAGDVYVTDNFSTIRLYCEQKGKKYYSIFLAPSHIIIDEDDFNKLYELMNK